VNFAPQLGGSAHGSRLSTAVGNGSGYWPVIGPGYWPVIGPGYWPVIGPGYWPVIG
jgi:hypothetical protein